MTRSRLRDMRARYAAADRFEDCPAADLPPGAPRQERVLARFDDAIAAVDALLRDLRRVGDEVDEDRGGDRPSISIHGRFIVERTAPHRWFMQPRDGSPGREAPTRGEAERLGLERFGSFE